MCKPEIYKIYIFTFLLKNYSKNQACKKGKYKILMTKYEIHDKLLDISK